MLNKEDLKKQIQVGLSGIYKPAFERIFNMMAPEKSEFYEEMSKDMADTFDELTAEPLADLLSSAIDYYVKNITITGTVITVGSPVTQVAQIVPALNPVTAGMIPNTLGIS